MNRLNRLDVSDVDVQSFFHSLNLLRNLGHFEPRFGDSEDHLFRAAVPSGASTGIYEAISIFPESGA